MKTSVCLAAYNGSLFIKEQIKSILIQLESDDELLIGDDCSSDDTVKIVQSFFDPRIKLYESKRNMGHVKNFERLIKQACGEVIFLSDQDDIWEIGKVATIRNVFMTHSNITLVHHALALIDKDGNVYDTHWRNLKVGSSHRVASLITQLLKAEIFGCALSFRSSIKSYLLPFPKDVYAHDHWIPLVNSFIGNAYNVDVPLVKYRQHMNNLTPKNGLSYANKIKYRSIQLKHFFHVFYRLLMNKIIISKNKA